MNKEDRALVKETKALIKEVESGDTTHAAWIAVQDRVQQLYEGRTQTEVAELIGKSQSWTAKLLRWDYSHANSPPWGSGSNKRSEVTAKALSDPGKRRALASSLPPEVLASVVADFDEERHAKVEAKRSEHRDDDSIKGIIASGESLDDLTASITESWADELIQRVHHNAGKLARHTEKWGLVLGSLTNDEALDMIENAERNVAEIRAALQERVRDSGGIRA